MIDIHHLDRQIDAAVCAGVELHQPAGAGCHDAKIAWEGLAELRIYADEEHRAPDGIVDRGEIEQGDPVLEVFDDVAARNARRAVAELSVMEGVGIAVVGQSIVAVQNVAARAADKIIDAIAALKNILAGEAQKIVVAIVAPELVGCGRAEDAVMTGAAVDILKVEDLVGSDVRGVFDSPVRRVELAEDEILLLHRIEIDAQVARRIGHVVPVDAAAAVDGINVCRAADGKEVVVTATKHVGVVAGVVHDGLRAASASERGRCGSHREAVHRADVSEFVVVIAE